MARTEDTNIYGEVNSQEDLREINRKIRGEMDRAGDQEHLTELKKRSDYLCTLAEAGSWEEKFGIRIRGIREVAKAESERTAEHANTIARRHGWEADYHGWGQSERKAA